MRVARSRIVLIESDEMQSMGPIFPAGSNSFAQLSESAHDKADARLLRGVCTWAAIIVVLATLAYIALPH
jgi:hypothetical protein